MLKKQYQLLGKIIVDKVLDVVYWKEKVEDQVNRYSNMPKEAGDAIVGKEIENRKIAKYGGSRLVDRTYLSSYFQL